MANLALLQIGDVAKATGVSPDTLRHYERLGLLPGIRRTAAGYRLFSREVVERVRLVRRALDLGFSLDELTRILRIRDQGGVPCRQVRELLAGKLTELDRRIEDLTSARSQLNEVLHEWDSKMTGTPEGKRSNLLESMLRQPQPQSLKRGIRR